MLATCVEGNKESQAGSKSREVHCTYLHERGDLHGNLRADTLQEEPEHLELEGESRRGVATGTSVAGVVRGFYRTNWP